MRRPPGRTSRRPASTRCRSPVPDAPTTSRQASAEVVIRRAGPQWAGPTAVSGRFGVRTAICLSVCRRGMGGGMKIRLLGPFDVTVDGRAVAVPRGRARSLLACLALSPGCPVSLDSLVTCLWGDDGAPLSTRQSLQNLVWRLRGVLGSDAVVADGDTYALRIAPDAVDVSRFTGPAAQRRCRGAAGGDPGAADRSPGPVAR